VTEKIQRGSQALLRAGDHVCVGATRQRLTKAIPSEERCYLFMVSFDPDVPVEAFRMPLEGIMTRVEPQFASVSADEFLQIIGTDEFYED